ncbi:DNase I-like protein [Dendrothele bispora CBS 962.96]|uniref:DNase I-like protein n=1 Tax=Dendrothele bispora (strain CBS 962.96) TaxID=1314807 RepID=A0A4S8MH03_DENBC|nr:DNase I-like protein [Dendrothele bispora CBS 962.96]
MAETRINIFTMNCWGLKYVSKFRIERIRALASELSKSTEYDIVALQELWVYSDFEHVRDMLSGHLPQAKFFYSGALGAGLAIFTRFPIISTEVHPYSLNGEPIDVGGGDWFVGKAAASVVLSHPVLGQLQVMNTHLYAKGGEDGPEYRRAHRLIGAWELAKIARQAAELGRYVIAVGDYNSIPSTLPIAIIRQHAGFSDSWLVTHPFSNASATIPSSPQDAIDEFGVTGDSPINSWSAGKSFDPQTSQNFGKRLDYVFYRQPRLLPHLNGASIPTLRSTDCRVMFTQEVPGATYSFSDHFGLRATIEIQNPSDTKPASASAPDLESAESQNAWSSAADSAEPSELSDATLTIMLEALSQAYQISKRRSRKELSVFILCVLVLSAVIISSPWFPHSWISPIFMVFNVAVAWWGTTMLYEGFLFGNWERNAYMNTIEELEIHQKALEAEGRRQAI